MERNLAIARVTPASFASFRDLRDVTQLNWEWWSVVEWTGLDWSNEGLPVCQHLCNLFWKSTYQLL